MDPWSCDVIATFPPPVASIVVFWLAIETPFLFGFPVLIPVIAIAVPEIFPEEMVLVEPL